jgi:hypothetical protein
MSSLREVVTQRAGGRCEYCHYPEAVSGGVLHIDHIFPPGQGGSDGPVNRALACPHCNLKKGERTQGADPETGQTVRLFNPRQDCWDDHFRLDRPTGEIAGLTPIGRATVATLGFNDPARVAVRLRLLSANLY